MNSKIIAVILVLLALMYPANAAVEVRGTVRTVTYDGEMFDWNAGNFAAFYYDIDKDVSSETLNITVSGSGLRTIEEDKLIYRASAQPANFTIHKDIGGQVDGEIAYKVVGWRGTKYVAVNGKANKLARLAYEMTGTDKVTVTSGNVWNLGSGYELSISAVDAKAAPRQAWVTLSRNGKIIDDIVVQHKGMYNYTTTVAGESDTLVFSVLVDSIFSGTSADMVQFKYAWLMDVNNVTEIKIGDSYGLLEVTDANVDFIVLKNKNTITLTRDSVIDVMDNIKFKVADSSETRFYPKIDISVDGTIDTITPTSATVVTTVAPTPVPTPVETVASAPVATIAPAPVAPPAPVVTATTAPVTTTPAESTPGFEAIFAIAGLVLVSFVVLRNRNR